MKNIEQNTVPVALGPTRVEMLYELWRIAIDHQNTWWVSVSKSQLRAAKELKKYGYAEVRRDLTYTAEAEYAYEARITQDGIDRLEAPMRLCSYELTELKPKPKQQPKLRRVK